MRVSRILVLSAMILGFGAHLRADLPFLWLDAPKGRDNKFDPKSPLFVPTDTPIIGTATNTYTRTSTLTSTPTLTPVPPTATPTPVWDAQDPGDNATGGATNLPISTTLQSISGRFIGASGDPADFFVVSLTSGNTYDFIATVVGSGSGVVVTLLASDGTTVLTAGSASGGVGSTSNINTYAAATTGTFYVKVTGGFAGYSLTYQDTTGATATNTRTATNTLTATNTATLTNTGTNTFTNTNTATPTNTVGGATATPTPTNTIPAGPHGALVTDFENNTANDKTLWDTSAVTSITA